MPKTIAAAQFRAQCLALLDEVGPEGLIITKRGRPVAKLVPIEAEHGDLIGSLEGKIRIRGDVMGTGLGWEAEEG